MSEPSGPCECKDPGCRTSHKGIARCIRKARFLFHRTDMEDLTGTAFCEDCANDAAESGLFYSKDDDDDLEEYDGVSFD